MLNDTPPPPKVKARWLILGGLGLGVGGAVALVKFEMGIGLLGVLFGWLATASGAVIWAWRTSLVRVAPPAILVIGGASFWLWVMPTRFDDPTPYIPASAILVGVGIIILAGVRNGFD